MDVPAQLTCPSCRLTMSAGAHYCPNCGTPLRGAPVRVAQPDWRLGWVIAAVILGVGVLLGSALSPGHNAGATPGATSSQNPMVVAAAATTPASSAAVSPSLTPIPIATSNATASFSTFGDGTFTVGKDLQTGTYRTRQAASGCYWARLSGFGGTLGEIITSDLTNNPSTVTIASSDKGFKSDGCGTWTSDLSAITSSKTSFGDGVFIVGTDVAPGTYKGTAQSGCYWARLSAFSGDLSDIITSDLTNSAAVVTISASDKGFKSEDCGPWTSQ